VDQAAARGVAPAGTDVIKDIEELETLKHLLVLASVQINTMLREKEEQIAAFEKDSYPPY
jgi:hypothetical protein